MSQDFAQQLKDLEDVMIREIGDLTTQLINAQRLIRHLENRTEANLRTITAQHNRICKLEGKRPDASTVNILGHEVTLSSAEPLIPRQTAPAPPTGGRALVQQEPAPHIRRRLPKGARPVGNHKRLVHKATQPGSLISTLEYFPALRKLYVYATDQSVFVHLGVMADDYYSLVGSEASQGITAYYQTRFVGKYTPKRVDTVDWVRP